MFENSSKNDLFWVFRKKKHFFFLITAQIFCFFWFMTHIQSKKSQLAEYDIVGIFAENLVEVGYVWWVDSGFFFFEFIKTIFNLKVAHCFY
jgi:hypothetical protein